MKNIKQLQEIVNSKKIPQGLTELELNIVTAAIEKQRAAERAANEEAARLRKMKASDIF